MINDPRQPFEIPNEMRALAERNVEQAKLAFTDYLRGGPEICFQLRPMGRGQPGRGTEFQQEGDRLCSV